MTKTITVTYNQTALDLAVQHKGTVEGVVDMLLDNGLSITEVLVAGASLQVNQTDVIDQDVLNYYTDKNLKPASAKTSLANSLGGYFEVTTLSIDPEQLKVKHNQTALDIALQASGTITSITDLLLQNNLSITDYLTVNQSLDFNTAIVNKPILNYYKNRSMHPATGKTIPAPIVDIQQILFENGLFENGLFE